jgi:hypothetical protein
VQDPIRSITLPTIDHGDVTITCPDWCIGHADHEPESHRADILHRGPDATLTFRGREISQASLVQSPFARRGELRFGGRIEGVSVSLIGQTLDPVGVYELAAELDMYAARLRSLAYELAVILAGGER